MDQITNSVTVRGSLVELPRYSHENHGRNFYKFHLEVPRLSGAEDVLPVVVAQDVLERLDVSGGSMLEIVGQLRSFNSRAETGRKLILSVYGDTITACESLPMNQVHLEGTICKAPIYRRTPLGREICDLMLAVPRPYRRTDYLPCILWGRTASTLADLTIGQQLILDGRMQSRPYIKVIDGESIQRIAYEVSATTATQV